MRDCFFVVSMSNVESNNRAVRILNYQHSMVGHIRRHLSTPMSIIALLYAIIPCACGAHTYIRHIKYIIVCYMDCEIICWRFYTRSSLVLFVYLTKVYVKSAHAHAYFMYIWIFEIATSYSMLLRKINFHFKCTIWNCIIHSWKVFIENLENVPLNSLSNFRVRWWLLNTRFSYTLLVLLGNLTRIICGVRDRKLTLCHAKKK